MSVFLRRLSSADGREVLISAEVPIQAPEDQGDWSCTYRIEGLGSSKNKKSMGVDAIQALNLALVYMSTTLYYSDEYQRGELTWPGGITPGDLGLPISERIREEVQAKIAQVNKLLNAKLKD